MKDILSILLLLLLAFNMDAQSNDMKYHDGDDVFKVTEQMPLFPGCEESADSRKKQRCSHNKMMKYIESNLIYPETAKKQKVEGRAILQFIVQKDGTLTEIKCIRNPGAGTGEAAMDILHKMNEEGIVWSPAKQRGKPVHLQYTLPVSFRLDKKEDEAMLAAFLGKDVKGSNPNGMPTLPPPPPPPPAPEEEVFKVVEQMPRFPGCEDQKLDDQVLNKCAREKMTEYIYANLVYPKIAKDNKIEGRAIIQAVINKKGKVENVRIVRDPGAGCGEAAKQVFEDMNDKMTWKPGKQRGRPVRVLITIPVKFEL